MNFKRYFGTDGIRGRVGKCPITPHFFLKLGIVIGKILFKNDFKRTIVGVDTRISSRMLESALNAGLSYSGILVMSTGIISTPAIGYLTKLLKLEVGIVISASHNFFEDNGIKLFLKGGVKLPISLERDIEKALRKPISFWDISHVSSITRISNAHLEYIKFCKSLFPINFNLKNFKIVLDCANGSTYKIAPKIFKHFSANLITTATCPDGYNINKSCGSMDVRNLQKIVLSEQADVGLALDGDGDRIIMIDHLGNKIDGDQILYILAKFYLYYQKKTEGVVGTIMSNNGLLVALKKLNVPFIKVDVGDKNIIQKLRQKKWRFGAENSGHIVILDSSPVCDGIIASLQILKVMMNTRTSLFQLCSEIKLLPRIIINVYFDKKNICIKYKKIKVLFFNYVSMLGPLGRIFFRKSGTEQCFRVIIEDENESIVTFISDQFKKIF